MTGRDRRWRRRTLLGLALSLLALAALAAAGAVRLREQARRQELGEARADIAARRFGRARRRLADLARRWPSDGAVWLALGECEMERSRLIADPGSARATRQSALDAFSKVPLDGPFAARAALLSANLWINTGHYAPAEEALTSALARSSTTDEERYQLERALVRLYRFEGRIDDVRLLLRASWGRSPDPIGVLRELWLLDHAPVPFEALREALEKADDDDDRVWLGRAHHAVLASRFDEAARWIDRALKKRPEGPAVWRAKLALARAADDLDGARAAAAHLSAGSFPTAEHHELRAWMAERLGLHDVALREWKERARLRPGDIEAIETLAVATARAGDAARARELRALKTRADHFWDRGRRIFLDPDLRRHAAELSEVCRALSQDFEAGAWGLVAEGLAVAPAVFAPPSPHGPARSSAFLKLPAKMRDRARALSATASAALERRSANTGPRLAGLFDDLRPPRGGTGTEPGPRSENGPNSEMAGASETRPKPWFVDHAARVGLKFTFENGRSPRRLLPETMSGGVGLIDFDGDGWLDVYCVQGGPADQRPAGDGPQSRSPGDRLFRNRGDGTFEDATRSSRIAEIAWGRGHGMGVAVGDYDNDGNADLFVTRLNHYALYRNRGDGTFEDLTERAGLSGRREYPSSAAFADLDNDGDLDLYVCEYMPWDPADPQTCLNPKGEYVYCDPSKVPPAPDHLFRNDGGRFRDVTEQAGIRDRDGRGLGVVAADLDGDGLVDLYVANDGTANYLFRNLGGFRFENVALEAGVAGSGSGGYQAGMGIACGDLNGDGRPDLLVTNFYGEGTTFHQNLGGGLFEDRSGPSGIGLATRYLLGFGIAVADVSNSGRLDVVAANGHVNDDRPYFAYAMPCRLYQNRPDGRLVDISNEAGEPWAVERVGRGLAAGDLDNDGRTDAIVVAQNAPLAYFHNQTERVGHFVAFRLEGTTSNRDGVGARVRVRAGGRAQTAQRLGGGSYLSASGPRLHFGLGASDRVDAVEVFWPSGKVDHHADLAADGFYRLREGGAAARLRLGPRAGRADPASSAASASASVGPTVPRRAGP